MDIYLVDSDGHLELRLKVDAEILYNNSKRKIFINDVFIYDDLLYILD